MPPLGVDFMLDTPAKGRNWDLMPPHGEDFRRCSHEEGLDFFMPPHGEVFRRCSHEERLDFFMPPHGEVLYLNPWDRRQFLYWMLWHGKRSRFRNLGYK